MKVVVAVILELIVLSVLWAIILGYSPQENKVSETTEKFFCHFVTNAQAKVVAKKATGQITISHNGNIIRYKYRGVNYVLTNSRCQFGLATKNVIIED